MVLVAECIVSSASQCARLLLRRELVRRGRSDFWAAVVMATTDTRHESDIADLLWTLRTWPLELIQWPVNNTQRLDIKFQPVPSGCVRSHTAIDRCFPWRLDCSGVVYAGSLDLFD